MERKGFIGGSDLYTLEHGDWHDLWLIKTGRKEPEDLSHLFRVGLGVETEMFNMRWFEIQTGIVVDEVQQEVFVNWENIPCKGTLDGVLANGNIIECKHTNSFKKMPDILNTYMGQIQFYMWLSNRHQTHMSVIFGNDWDTCVVQRDNDIMDQYLTLMERFWKYVRTDTAPPSDLIGDKIDWKNVKVDGLVARDASKENFFVQTASQYIETLDQAKDNEACKKELRSMINDNEREVFCDLLSIKRSKNGACRIVVNNKEAANG